MEILDVLFFIIAAIMALYLAVWLAGAWLVIGLPGGLCAIGTYLRMRSKLIAEQHSPAVIADTMHPRYFGLEVMCRIDEVTLVRRVGITRRACLVAAASIPGVLLVGCLTGWSAAFPTESMLHFGASDRRVVVAALFVLFILANPVTAFLVSRKRLYRKATNCADELVRQCNGLLNASAATAGRLDRDIHLISSQLKIEWPFSITNEAFGLLQKDPMSFLMKPGSYEEQFAMLVRRAEDEIAALTAAQNEYADVLATYDGVVQVAVSLGAQFLLRKLEQIQECMCFANETLLPRREWAAYREVVSKIRTDLEETRQAAESFAHGSDGESTTTQHAHNSDMTPEAAFELFGLTDVTATAEMVREKFRLLSLVYHPDRGASPDALMFKRICQAHEILGECCTY